MRLFLSSDGFGKYPEALIELVGDNTKTALINNAKDDLSFDDRSEKTEEKKHDFHQLGFDVHELDLRSYFGQPEKLDKDLKKYGLVWASGGNTFILRRAMKASGMDKILKKRLDEDSIVYGGSSAGSCVTAPSLKGIQFGDEPDTVPEHYDKKVVWSGLNLVPFMIVPHCESGWFSQEAKKTIEYLKTSRIAYKELSDGQVIIIEADKVEFLK